MEIKTKIREDMRSAMRAHEGDRVTTLRGLLAAFTNELVAQKRPPTEELSEADVLTVLKRAAKQRKDSIEQFEKGGRQDLADKEKFELAIVESYLPAQTSEEDIRKVVQAKIAEFGGDKSNLPAQAGMGQIIGAVVKEFAGNADGAVVKRVVTELLQ